MNKIYLICMGFVCILTVLIFVAPAAGAEDVDSFTLYNVRADLLIPRTTVEESNHSALHQAMMTTYRDKFISNLENDTTLKLTERKRDTLLAAAATLLEAKYEPTFVAGVLSNVLHEGSTGQFEGITANSSNPYQVALIKRFPEYTTKYSYKIIYGADNYPAFSLSELDALLAQLAADKWEKGKFGLGAVQWTGERTAGIFSKYKEMASGRDTLTYDETVLAESMFIMWELQHGEKRFTSIYPDWIAESEGKSDSDKAYIAGSNFCRWYEAPKNYETVRLTRGEKAREVWEAMLGGR